jgi:ankyrin repeat protein
MENVPDEILLNILQYTGIEGTLNYIEATGDTRAQDNYLWYEFSKDYYNFPYNSDEDYYQDVTHLMQVLQSVSNEALLILKHEIQWDEEENENISQQKAEENLLIKYIRQNDDIVLIKYLISHYGVNHLYLPMPNDLTPLIFNVRNPSVADYLAELDSSMILFKTDFNETALFFATTPEMAQWFIDHGVNVNAINDYDGNALFIDRNISIEMAKVLVDNGINVNQVNGAIETPLTFIDNFETIKYLYNNGADINHLSGYRENLLHQVRNPEIAQWLIDLGLDVNQLDTREFPPLFNNNSLDVIKVLIANGANINYKLEEFNIITTHLNYPDIVKYLFDNHYASLNRTAIDQTEDIWTLEALLPYGLDFNQQDDEGKSLLHDWVKFRSNILRIEFAIQHGANVNARDNKGKTPLSYATNFEIRKLLISHGATV